MLIDQKTQEISLAIIKVSVYARRVEFRHKLEKLAIQLIEEVASRDFVAVLRTIEVLGKFIEFGKTIYEIEPINAEILIKDLSSLNSAIRQIAELSAPDLEKMPSITLDLAKDATLFDSVGIVSVKKDNKKSIKAKSNNSAMRQKEKSDIDKNKEMAVSLTAEDSDNAAIRQSAIIEKMRQFGSNQLKLKDIIAEFPDFSERTLRYDIQRLCNQGIVERKGSGGPGTYYKLRVI